MDAIESALDEIRPGLDSDGFDLKLESYEPGGRVLIGLHAREDACHDCLVPDEVLWGIIDMNIRERVPDVGEVVLEKHGF